jgi:ankyrin repeat protein
MGHVKCVRLLINSNADVQLQVENGLTGLTVAALKGHLECFNLMIDATKHQMVRMHSLSL